MNEDWKCMICAQDSMWRWTDTHGVAQHVPCGAPYRIYHYDENKKRIEGVLPAIALKQEYIDLCRYYWTATKKPIPGGHSFHPSYEMTTEEERDAFYAWIKEREAVKP